MTNESHAFIWIEAGGIYCGQLVDSVVTYQAERIHELIAKLMIASDLFFGGKELIIHHVETPIVRIAE